MLAIWAFSVYYENVDPAVIKLVHTQIPTQLRGLVLYLSEEINHLIDFDFWWDKKKKSLELSALTDETTVPFSQGKLAQE